MRRTYWYHEECLVAVETATRTSKSPHHELCARCGYEGLCVEAELVTNPDVRKIEVPEPKLEAESIEETEALEEVIEEAVEAVLEVEEQREESPEETAPAEAVEPIEEEVAAPSPEEEAEAAKKVDIARLEAELAELRK